MKTHLLAMSFDAASSPGVHFPGVSPIQVAGRVPCGWGFAWYPEGDSAAAVVKDPTSTGHDAVASVLQDWDRFRSTVFISFVLGAARRRTQQDTHPFTVRYAARDWVLTHNGNLKGFREALPLEEPAVFEPAGKTDSEHVLCWIVSRLREAGARSLLEFGWQRLRQLFGEINRLGTANLVLSDGHDLVIYHDAKDYNDLYWTRQTPPYQNHSMELGLIRLDMQDAHDFNRSFVVFSSVPASDQAWEPMAPGQMLVTRRAALVWDSVCGGRPQSRRRQIAVPAAVPSKREEPSRSRKQQLIGRDERVGREVRIHHETIYRYQKPVEKSIHLFRLQPVHDPFQDVVEHSLELSVDGGIQRHFEDVFGNHTVELSVGEPFEELRVLSQSVVRIHARAYDALEFPNQRCSIPLVWMPWQRQMMEPFLLPPELPETELLELSEFAMAAVERCDYDLLETLVELNQSIFVDFEYVPRSTTLETTPYDVFTSRRGVCQDFANLLICLARLLNVPARYRVGYIHTGADYHNQAQSDASHAWAELYLPWIGWRGFDPTNGFMVGADHVRVACGRNYRDATPTSGTLFRGGGGETMQVVVRVEADEP